CGGCWPAE
ncbi:fibronectin type III domain protein, partial [Escherichia coli EC1849]